MLKSKTKKLAIASVLSLTTLVSLPFNALASVNIASNLSELQSAIYTDMTARDTLFSINYTGPSTNSTIGNDVSTAAKAAEKSDDYLNWSWNKFAASLSGTQGNYTINFNVGYLTTAAQEQVVTTDVNQALSSIITPGMTADQKEAAINKWICDNTSYDYTLTKHSAYDALVAPHTTVCQGYSLLGYKMLIQVGIPAKIITGTLNGESHAWLMVQIGGNWYHLDITNNDINNNMFYNVTDAFLTQHGFVWDKTAFPAATTTYVAGSTTPKEATTINLNKAIDTLTVRSSDVLTAMVTPSKSVTWTSSDPTVVTVTNGTIKGIKAGTATITATTSDNATAKCTVTVNAAPVVTLQPAITMSKTSLSINAGKTASITARESYANSTKPFPFQNVVWKSSDPSVATVQYGRVSAIKAGTTTISVTLQDGTATASCEVKVAGPVQPTTIKLDKATDTLNVGSTDTLTPTVTPSKTVTWISSNPAVVTVTNGVIKGVKAGTAVITATTSDNVKATCTVTVSAPSETLIPKITISKTSLTLLKGRAGSLTARESYANSTKAFPWQNAIWSSSNPSVATVQYGRVIAVAPGTTTITITLEDGTASDSCVVTVK